MPNSEENAIRLISAAVSALQALLDGLQRSQGDRYSSPETVTAARAVREMQDAVAQLPKGA
jgi:hypothetical protein